MVTNIGDEETQGGGGGDDERGISVALTRNYVSGSNLSDVLRFLDTRVSQISGCRDREEAVQPEELGREFRKGLLSVAKSRSDDSLGEEKKGDDNEEEKGRWTELLEKAEQKAKEGWGCDAWVDLPSSCPRDRNANRGDCDNDNTNNDKVQSNESTRTSVLERAKQSLSASVECGIGAVSASSSSFSFSFL